MASIGTVTRKSDASFEGTLTTATLSTPIKLVPLDNGGDDNKPTHRVIGRNGFEMGAAWNKTSRETGADYTSVKIDAPELPSVLYANLGKAAGTHPDAGIFALIWNRR